MYPSTCIEGKPDMIVETIVPCFIISAVFVRLDTCVHTVHM